MASRSHSESDIPNSSFSSMSTTASRFADRCDIKCMDLTADIKGDKSSYKGIVNSAELHVTKLTAELCKTNNCVPRTGHVPTAARGSSLVTGINADFCVQTEHAAHYADSLHTRVPLELFPLSSCPDRARHVADIQTLSLPMACPTCWSLQRLPEPRIPERQHQRERRSAVKDCKTAKIKMATVR